MSLNSNLFKNEGFWWNSFGSCSFWIASSKYDWI